MIEYEFNGVKLPEMQQAMMRDLIRLKQKSSRKGEGYDDYDFYIEAINHFHAQLPPGLVQDYYQWQSENCKFD